ncbi:hypothetical protein B484DRAFT_449804 [Ochromonadaceae sp. CCMP2298]|nr:hypothetical protein B484DRAFT_449804 [Ochromonadaceae sp. CCMP2298]
MISQWMRPRNARAGRAALCSSNASTHEVFNQAAPLQNLDVFRSDPALFDSVRVFGGSHTEHLAAYGVASGTAEMQGLAELAERNRPVLTQFDRCGRRIDVVEYHDAYHSLMQHALTSGAAGLGFASQGAGSQVARAALINMQNQIEPGHCCPVVMTAAAIPVLRRVPELSVLAGKLTSLRYDRRDVPMEEKEGITIGMSMTEKQGGSDVRANTTTSTPLKDGPKGWGGGPAYSLTGHKWFTSAPMCDAFLTLAQTADPVSGRLALSCFLVPRWKPDGTRNTGFQVMRLKDKLGDRANASSEVEYRGAWAQMLGRQGAGVRTIIEMVQSTRLDCALGSAGTARRALQLALQHAAGRAAFGAPLLQQPLMRTLLTDLCVETEAHTVGAMHMAKLFDNYCQIGGVDGGEGGGAESGGDLEHSRDLFRAGVSVAKYFTTKRLPSIVYECMEALGGNGYVEDFPLARLYRQAPLNSIWEGSGNVLALDLLRAHASLPLLLQDMGVVRGADSRLDAFYDALGVEVAAVGRDPSGADSQRGARGLADRLALGMQAAALVRFGDAQVAEAFVAARIPALGGAGGGSGQGGGGLNFGARGFLSESATQHILDRNMAVLVPPTNS